MAFYEKRERAKASPSDILAQKKNQLASHNAQFDSAVSLVTGTIDRLEEINASIESEVSEINEYQKGLSETKDSLNTARLRNEQIIKNFHSLIERTTG